MDDEQLTDAERSVIAALRDGGPPVPPALVTTIRDRVNARYGAGGKARVGVRWQPLAVGALAAALVALVALVAGGTSSSGPTIAGAAKLAYVPAAAPPPGASNSSYLDVSYGGVTFPNYARAFAAVPTGQLSRRIGGRPQLTVFYRLRDGTRLSYTVYSGAPVAVPAGARTVVYRGITLRVFRVGRRLAVVTLVRHGRTCVLAAPTAPSAILALAEEPLTV